IFGEDIDAAVRSLASHDVHLQLEVAEAVVLEGAVVVAMARSASGDDGAVLNREGFGRPRDFPAAEILAVEEGGESGLDRGSRERQADADHQRPETMVPCDERHAGECNSL